MDASGAFQAGSVSIDCLVLWQRWLIPEFPHSPTNASLPPFTISIIPSEENSRPNWRHKMGMVNIGDIGFGVPNAWDADCSASC